MDAVIYTRVSRLADGRSVQDQEKECRAWCEANDHAIDAVFTDDGISASRYGKTRDAWEALKDYLRPGHILVAWEASRTTRDLEEYVALRNLCANHNVLLAYAGRVLDLNRGDDRFVGGLDALISERESEQLKLRVMRGKRNSAAAGRPPSRPPWGYRRVELGVRVPDEVDAPRIREAVERVLAGDTMYSVLQWLRENPGRYTPGTTTMMKRCLANPALAGMRVFQGQVVGKGTWTPIITEEEHHALLARFGRARAVWKFQSIPGPEPKHLLSGIAKCGVCKGGLRHRTRPNGRRERKAVYVCYKNHVSRGATFLDDLVERKLLDLLSRVNPAEFTSEDPKLQQAMQDLLAAEEELEGWMQSAEAGEVSRIAFARMEKVLTARIEGLRERLQHAPAVAVDIAHIKQNWDQYDTRRKRGVIRAFFTIDVMPVDRTPGRRGASEESVAIRRIT